MLSRRSFIGAASFFAAAPIPSLLPSAVAPTTPAQSLPVEFQEALDESGVTLIAGHPRVGKTAVAAYIACHVAYASQRRVLWVSLDETTERVAHRMAGLRQGLLPHRWSMQSAYEKQRSDDLFSLEIRDDWSLLRQGSLSAFVRSLPPNYRPALVVVDGLDHRLTKKVEGQYRPQSLKSFLYGSDRAESACESFLYGSDGVEIALGMDIPVLCTMPISRKWEEERPEHERPSITEVVASIRDRNPWFDLDSLWDGAVSRAWLLSSYDRGSPADEGAIELAMYQEPLAAPVTRKYNFNDLMTGLPLTERT